MKKIMIIQKIEYNTILDYSDQSLWLKRIQWEIVLIKMFLSINKRREDQVILFEVCIIKITILRKKKSKKDMGARK